MGFTTRVSDAAQERDPGGRGAGARACSAPPAPGRNAPIISTISAVVSGGPVGCPSHSASAARGAALAERADLDDQYGQYRLPDEHDRLRQRAGRPQPDQQGGGVWGRVIAGTVDTKTNSTGTLDLSRLHSQRQSGHRHAELQYHDPAGLLGLPGRPRHLHPERRRHRRQLALGRDGRLPRGQDQGHHAGRTFTNPNFPALPSPRRRDLQRRHRRCRSSASTRPSPRATSSLDGQARWDFYQNSLSDPQQRPARARARRARLLADRQRRLQHSAGQRLVHRAVRRRRLVARQGRSAQRAGRAHARRRAASRRGTVTIDDIESVLGRASFTRRHELHVRRRRLAALLHRQRVPRVCRRRDGTTADAATTTAKSSSTACG